MDTNEDFIATGRESQVVERKILTFVAVFLDYFLPLKVYFVWRSNDYYYVHVLLYSRIESE